MSRRFSSVLILIAGLSSGFSASAMPVTLQNTFGRESGLIFGISGLLQLCVAGYAIRLNRLFGMTRVGWSLFLAFTLLAILHLIQAIDRSDSVNGFHLNVEVVYALISLLLLIGMAHLHAVLKEQVKRKLEVERMRDELRAEVQKQTAHLASVIDELKLEIDERRRAEEQVREQARLLDLTHDAILVQDLEGRILYWNKGSERVYGWSAEEALGRKRSELLGSEVLPV